MRFLLYSLIFLCSTTAWAQTADPSVDRSQLIDQALENVEQGKTTPNSWEQENAEDPYIILLNEYQTRINDDWSFEETYHTRVKIQKDEAKDLGEWPIYYNKSRENITSVKAFVETPDGKIVEATKIQDEDAYEKSPMYADVKVKVVSLPQVNVGTIIDIEVKTKTLHKLIPGQFWDDIAYPAVPTKYSRHTYIFPETKAIKFHSYNIDTQPTIDKKDGLITESFVFERTDDTGQEDFIPPLDETTGIITISSMPDWKQLADWEHDLINKNTVDDKDITAKTAELIKDKTTTKDKVRAIIEYIQDNFRFVSMTLGDHNVDFHSTDEIFKSKYGDCKDLSLLTRQMLKIAGIDSNICFFSGEFNGDPLHGLPSPDFFDYVILEVSIDGQSYFIDPQTKGFDIGQLPTDYDNAHVFVLDDKGYHFDHLPVAGEELHSIISSSDITVADDGSAYFDVHVQMPLEASQNFKNSWGKMSKEDRDKFFLSLEGDFAQGGQMIDRQVSGLENRYGLVNFSLKYTAPKAYPIVNDMLLLEEAQEGDMPDFPNEKRKYPIFMPNNSLIKNRNVYHLPKNFKIDFMPQSYDIALDFMQVTTTYTKAEGSITVDSNYRMKRALIPADRYVEVKNFRKELYQKNDQYIVLRRLSNLSSDTKDWLKSSDRNSK